MLYFSDRLRIGSIKVEYLMYLFLPLCFFFSHSTLLGLHEYVQSHTEKRKVLQEIQQTKSHELVGT